MRTLTLDFSIFLSPLISTVYSFFMLRSNTYLFEVLAGRVVTVRGVKGRHDYARDRGRSGLART